MEEAEALEESRLPATPAPFEATYTSFEVPTTDPVSDDDFAEIGSFLQLFETCTAELAFGVTRLQTEDLAGYSLGVEAADQGLSVEEYVPREEAATPEPSQSLDSRFAFRVMFLPYQAWNLDEDNVLPLTVVTVRSSLGEYDDETANRLPPPDRFISLLVITLERDGDEWLWADINAKVDPAVVAPRS